MSAKDVQIRIVANDLASKAFQDVGNSASRAARQMQDMSRSASGIVFNAASITAGIVGFQGLSAAIRTATDMTVNFAQTMETNQIGISGILSSMTQIKGENLRWNEAMFISKNTMSQLNDEALKTAATSEEMVTTFRGLLGPGLAAKMTISEIVQLTSTGVNAVKSLGLNNTQLVQELRDLVQGGIQPASSTLATALGLKDKDIKAAKQSAEGLFKFLMDRLEGFKTASLAIQDTFTGKIDMIKEGITRVGSLGTAPLFEVAKNALDQIANKFLTINQGTKEITLNQDLITELQSASKLALTFANSLRQAGEPIISIIVPGLNIMGQALVFVANNTKAVVEGIALWYSITKLSAIYIDIAAAATGATTANTLLGGAVLALRPAYQQAMAQSTLAATVQAGAARAAATGYYSLSNHILYCADNYVALGVSAQKAAAMQLEAASAAAAGNFKLTASILDRQAAEVAAGAKAAYAGRQTIIAGSGAMAAVRALTQTVWGLVGGWVGVAVATTYALYKLNEYLIQKDEMKKAEDRAAKKPHMPTYSSMKFDPGDDQEWLPVDGLTVQNKQKQNKSYWNEYVWQSNPRSEYEKKQAEEDALKKRLEEMQNGLELDLKFPQSPDDKKGKDLSKKLEQFYEEGERLKDKLADMTAKMDEKIMEETGSVFQLNSKKVKDEIDNMQRDLQKSMLDLQKHGIDISPVQAKMVEYQNTMAEKIKRIWRDAWQDVKNQTALISAQITEDKKAEAEAQYQIELLKIEKERRQRLKDIQVDKNDTEAEAAVNNEADLKKKLALQKRDYAINDDVYAGFQRELERAGMLVNLEGKTQTEIDAIRSNALYNYQQKLREELKAKDINDQRKLKLEKELNETITQQREIAGRNLVTAADEAMRRIKQQQFDYAQVMVNTYNQLYGSAETHLNKMLEGTESFSQGMRGIFADMINDIEQMMVKMWMNQTIMQPLQSLWGDMLQRFYGGKTGGNNNVPVNVPIRTPGGFNSDTVLKPYAKGGYNPGGWALVGEEGPELVKFNIPGRVYTANQTRNILSASNQPPKITVNVINQTGVAAEVRQEQPQWNGCEWTINMWLKGISGNVGGSRDILRSLAR